MDLSRRRRRDPGALTPRQPARGRRQSDRDHGDQLGGYLTCIVAGLDHRLKVAVPVYGCGF